MLFWERFYSICLENNTKPNIVCNNLGLSNATATHWKNGVIPKADIVLKLSYYFDCSTDYLLGRTNELVKQTKNIPIEQHSESNELQQRLIGNYNMLNDAAQKALVDYSDFMITKSENLKAGTQSDKNVS